MDNQDTDFMRRLRYNAKDCMATFKVWEELSKEMELYPPANKMLYKFEVNQLHPEVMRTMCRGVKVDKIAKEAYYNEFKTIIEQSKVELNNLLGFEYKTEIKDGKLKVLEGFNTNSSTQKKKLLKEFFGIELEVTKKKKANGSMTTSETADAKAMFYYIEKYPQFAPFFRMLVELNVLEKFTNTFLAMQLEDTGRIWLNYKIAGTNSGRFGSTKNIFGRGANVANLPEKGKLAIEQLLLLLEEDESDDILEMY